MSHVLADFVRQVHSSHTLRTVARTRKTNQQQRTLFIQQILGMSNQIGRSHRTHILPYAAHNGQQSITDKRRCAGSGQHDIRLRGQILVHECTNLSLVCQQCFQLLPPHRRLLMNLIKCKPCVHIFKVFLLFCFVFAYVLWVFFVLIFVFWFCL